MSNIHPANTEVIHASIAWDIRICERTGYMIDIRSITLDGVEISGAELSNGVKHELRDIIENSPEYDPSYISGMVKDLRWEAEQDERADRARQGAAIERDMND